MIYYIKQKWFQSAQVCVLLILEWGLQAAASLLMIQTFDAIFRLNAHDFLFWTGINLVTWGLYFATSCLREIVQARTIRILNNEVRHDLYRTLLEKSYQDFHKQDSGEYISWLTNDVKQMESLAWKPFFECVGRGAQVCWCILALTSIHWSLVVAAGIISLLMWFVPKVFEKRLERRGKDCSEKQASAVGELKDLLSGFDIFRLFQKEKHFLEQADASSELLEKPSYRLKRAQTIAYGLMGYVNVVSQFITDVLVMFLAFSGRVSVGVFAGAGNLTGGVATGLDAITKNRLSFSAGKPYFQKIQFQTKPISGQKGESQIVPMEHGITLQNVSFQYGNAPVLDNISMSFEKGKKYALVGPSGCGKSTLLKLLLGWLPDYSGAISIDGTEIRNFTPEQLQRQMSYIPQNVFLFNTTVRENITLGDSFSEEEIQKALRESALAQEVLTMEHGLDTVVGEGGNGISGGQKQRIAIARALIHKRSILLVDEGTSALDRQNADIVENTLLCNPELTLILVSHHLSQERKAQFEQVYEMG